MFHTSFALHGAVLRTDQGQGGPFCEHTGRWTGPTAKVGWRPGTARIIWGRHDSASTAVGAMISLLRARHSAPEAAPFTGLLAPCSGGWPRNAAHAVPEMLQVLRLFSWARSVAQQAVRQPATSAYAARRSRRGAVLLQSGVEQLCKLSLQGDNVVQQR